MFDDLASLLRMMPTGARAAGAMTQVPAAPSVPQISAPWLSLPVGSERMSGGQSLTMPSPSVSPVVGSIGGKPVTAATNEQAQRMVGVMAGLGTAEGGGKFGDITPPPRPVGAMANVLYDMVHGVSQARFDEFHTSPGRQAELAKLEKDRIAWVQADQNKKYVASLRERLAEPGITEDGKAKLRARLDRAMEKMQTSIMDAQKRGVDHAGPFPSDPWYARGMSLEPPPMPSGK